ncbi:hypothetical protein NEOLEDRAFT_128727 [Neolentinus lepideus HHB14362 ss-1]|uniref:Uncharacterized protein n=1 Tax=Neolentinus lepideus HHB14362 ss-1 TaxID=1314782 RepID=A0A165MQV7_9AGAM|nr:hypothetical protein NEOLEDRAFT_128727 [Neolentinus lepideus HHB14362 ss-1]
MTVPVAQIAPSAGPNSPTLPPELLSDIFTRCLAIDHRGVASTAPSFILTRVSRYWRDVAFSTPRLWREVGVKVNENERFEAKAAFMRWWLSYSGDGPLTISLTESCDYSLPFASPTMDVISEYLYRCETLFICVPEPRIHFLRTPHAPLLCNITVEYDSRIDAAHRRDLSLAFAPYVRELVVEWTYLQRLRPCSVQWTRLHTLDLHGILSAYATLEVLQECSSLKHCDLTFYELEDEEDAYPLVVHMNELESLVLSYGDGCGINDVLRQLCTPRLTSLHIIAADMCEVPLDVWRSIVPKSGSSLKDLSIRCEGCITASFEAFLDLLRPMNDLEDLAITGILGGDPFDGFAEDFFRALTIPLGEDQGPLTARTLLPRLREFNVTGVSRNITQSELCLDVCIQSLSSSRPERYGTGVNPGLRLLCVQWYVQGDAYVRSWCRQGCDHFVEKQEDPSAFTDK